MTNLNSKLVVFRVRERISVSGNPLLNEGVLVERIPSFSQIDDQEYERGRAELLNFRNCRGKGITVVVKKVQDQQTSLISAGTPTAYVGISELKSTCRMRYVGSPYYSTANQFTDNPVAIDTATGVKNITYSGTKCMRYTVPMSRRAGCGEAVGNAFPAAKPALSWPGFLELGTLDVTTSDTAMIPTNYIVHVDSWPTPNSGEALSHSHISTFEVYTYYYVEAFGKHI